MFLSELEAVMEKVSRARRVILCSDEQMATKVRNLADMFLVGGLYKIVVNEHVPPDEIWVIKTPYWDSIEPTEGVG